MKPTPRNLGEFADAHHFPGGAMLSDAVCEEPAVDEDRIAGYLRAGSVLATTGRRVDDFIDSTQKRIAPQDLLTDGAWMWPADLAYYVERYHVRLPAEFVEQAAARGFQPPQLTDEDLVELAEAMQAGYAN